jgi:hypothetical protein
MIRILIDHNIEGQAKMLWDTFKKAGFLELCQTEFVMFTDVGLSENLNDRDVWHFIQANQMLLLTDNRSDNEDDSLEQTIRDENMLTSMPVITIGKISRFKNSIYREKCAERIAEIIFELKNYLGTGRIFIP